MKVLAVLGNNQSHLRLSGVASDLGVGVAPDRSAKSVAEGHCPGMVH